MGINLGSVPEPVQPISPQRAKEEKYFHPDLINAVNSLILEKYDGRSASIKLKDIKERFNTLNTDPSWTIDRLFAEHQFDFEPLFRKAGWKVTFDKPGWDENYDAYFEFKG